MMRNSASTLVRHLRSQASKSSAISAGEIPALPVPAALAYHSISHLNAEVGPCATAPTRGGNTSRERKGGGREYSTGSGTGFRSSGPVQLGIAQPLEPVQFSSDIIPEDLVFNRAPVLKDKPPLDTNTLRFGAEYTDHMLQINWKAGLGWAAPSIDPFAPMSISPCSQVLHYGTSCFEGMKAFRTKEGEVRLFRPDMNMNRLHRSAARLALPTFDKGALLECIKELLRVERDWIPDEEGFSCYMRPTIISTHPHLGLGPPGSATFFCVLSPVGPYFEQGLKPIKLFVDKTHVRAFPGGVGDCKVAGNYSPTVLSQLKGAELGCSQVLYVLDDGRDGGTVGESGAMNIFFVLRKEGGKLELATPPLNGVILPGVTRDSVLALTRSFGGIEVSERRLTWDEIVNENKQGNILEIFGTGTACLVQPVASLVTEDEREVRIPFDEEAAEHWIKKPQGVALAGPQADEPFSLTGRLTRTIIDIQYGRSNSEWSVPLD